MIFLLLYLFLSLLAILQLRLVYKAEKEYGLPYLSLYRTYLIIYYVYGFIKFIGLAFIYEFFTGRIDESIISSQISLLIFPFIALEFYWLLLWIRKLTGRSVSKPLRISYWVVQSSLFAFMVVNMILNIRSHHATLDRLWSTVHYTEWIIFFAILIQIFFPAKGVKSKLKKRFVNSLGLIYVCSFASFEAFQVFGIPFLSADPLYYFVISGGLYFCVHIPALFFQLHFFYHHHHEIEEFPISDEEMRKFCLAYNITPREREIIELIVKGKSNQEIGERLFVSPQTVKNINTNIYKKTEVKNRIQLFNRIQELRSRRVPN